MTKLLHSVFQSESDLRSVTNYRTNYCMAGSKMQMILILMVVIVLARQTEQLGSFGWIAKSRIRRQDVEPINEPLEEMVESVAEPIIESFEELDLNKVLEEPAVELIEALDESAMKDGGRAKIQSMNIESEIKLRYARTLVSSRVVNPAKVAQTATFHVVLPETAFISGFLMEIGGKVYEAKIKEKEKAQQEFGEAVQQGQTAAHISTSARDANQFTVSVNIEPKAKVTFNLTYEELLTRRHGHYEHAIHINPGVIVPKLKVRVHISEVLPISDVQVPELSNDLLEEDDSKKVNSLATIIQPNTTEVIVIYEPSEEQQKVISKDGVQGQFIVQYDVDRSSLQERGGELHVVDGYFVHFFAPRSLPSLPKHVVFVLDTSGSMIGTKLDQTKQAMDSILEQLRPEDYFSVVEFSSDAVDWNLAGTYTPPRRFSWSAPDEEDSVNRKNTATEPVGPYDDIFIYPASELARDKAKSFVKSMDATGGTNINEALLRALKSSGLAQTKLNVTSMIIFLTDGDPTEGVTDSDAITANVKKANSDGLVPIFSLAFGTGADFGLLKKISSQNSGFVRKIYEASDATLQLKGFFSEVASLLLTNVKFIYEGQVENVTESTVANYFQGSEVVVTGRVTDLLQGSVSATSANGSYLTVFNPNDERSIPCGFIKCDPVPNVPETDESSFSLEKIWAYLTIKQLLEKSESQDDPTLRRKALDLSLKYHLVTPLTSLLVIKPNDSSSDADLRPADAGVFDFDRVGVLPISLASLLSRPQPQMAAFIGQALPLIELAEPGPVELEEGAQLEIEEPEVEPEVIEEPEVVEEIKENETSTTATSSSPAPPMNDAKLGWILANIFSLPHNESHVSVSFANETLSLLWLDEPETLLSDTPCTVDGSNSTVAVCRSIWSCPTTLDYQEISPIELCAIENRYVGVCCVPILKEEH